MARRKWTPPESAAPYLDAIAQAEIRSGIPADLLARLIDQESAFRPEIIDGTQKSSAGAVGIAQIVPRWHPEVNPLDPFASIAYAGQYLRSLYNSLGSWPLALAAYNWGIGNMTKAIDDLGGRWVLRAPTETLRYVSAITGDIPSATRPV